MKKLMIIAAASFLGFQTAQAQVSFSPEVGLNLSKYVGEDANDDNSFKTGFKVGANVNIPVASNFYVAPGLFYTTKGNKNEVSPLGITTTYTQNLGYLELPINLMYRMPLGSSGAFFVSAGPYVAYAVNGKAVTKIGDNKTEGDIKFGDGLAETKPFDYGFNAGVGYETPYGFYIRAQYGMGLASFSNVDNYDTKNSSIQLGIGYNLGTY